ncbi:deoxyhypusine hydroxylase [Ceratobasidium sp. 395]|nr:deoxyhypusine hydroxylase [Ceratobasidium sp. 395]
MATQETFDKLEASLLNTPGDIPLHARFRSLFTLKSLPSQQSIDIISKGFSDESALLKHELAYVLGQMGDSRAIPALCNVLSNEDEDPMVRHEAAEALGALSAESAKPLLEKYLTCPERAVRETCEIALDKIKWDATPEGQAANKRAQEMKEQGTAQYTSVDPAPASSSSTHSKLVATSGTQSKHDSSPDTIADLRSSLLDTSKPLFERYRAMFALRDIGTASAVDALAAGLSDSSALFKVRHEAAEALGGIATPEVLPILREWASQPDAPRVVRESCVVALDMYEYADGLSAQPVTAVNA